VAAARAAAAVPATLLDDRKERGQGSMDETKAPEYKKRLFVKPELKRVDLRPEEAVLGSCKFSASSGPGSSGNCSPAGAACSTAGS
jgi:hypothetical protein